MRLIDAEKLWMVTEGKHEYYEQFEIDEAPTVDAVSVIRCKDCKWYGRADKRRFYRGMDCLQNRIDTIVPDKDYCSRAERMDKYETD